MVNFIFIISLFLVTWGTAPLPVKGELNCTINNLTHNYLAITDVVYDSDLLTTLPYTYKLNPDNVTNIVIDFHENDDPGGLVSVEWHGFDLVLSVKQIDETIGTSKSSQYFYNFTIELLCQDTSYVKMYTTFQIIDTNNHVPFFDKPKYTYNLISSDPEDFVRLQTLNPITATDYDLTNGELIFSISENDYFDVEYNGIVPGTKNKKHYARIVPKVPGASIVDKLEMEITVIDVGYPSNKNVATLVINPPSPPVPIFDKPFYVGHYFSNHTLRMKENPKLEGGTTYYVTEVRLQDINSGYNIIPFAAEIKNDEIIIRYYSPISELTFFKNNYLPYVLTATYRDTTTSLETSGSATFIAQLHHET